MYIKYVEHELKALFESEPISIAEKEVGMFIYSKEDNRGAKFILNCSIYEKKCTISLGLGDSTALKLSLEDVASLVVHDDILKIRQNNSEKEYIIYFEPNFYITFDKKINESPPTLA